MAHGILCRYCGFQETAHVELIFEEDDDLNKVYPTRTHSFNECPGFSPDFPLLHEELDLVEQVGSLRVDDGD